MDFLTAHPTFSLQGQILGLQVGWTVFDLPDLEWYTPEPPTVGAERRRGARRRPPRPRCGDAPFGAACERCASGVRPV